MRIPHIGRVKAAVLALAVAVPVTASALENGPYVGLEGGLNLESTQHLDIDGVGSASTKFKPGWIGGIVSGYSFANGFRPELEVDFRRNQLRKLDLTGVGSTTDVGGFENLTTIMGNVWYDLKMPSGIFSKLHPYIGGGLGIGYLNLKGGSVAGTPFVDDTAEGLFAIQGGAGLGYEINRHLIASLDWRYLQTEDSHLQLADGSGQVTGRYRSNSVLGSIRYNFGLKPKPVAYVPPPPPPEPTYVPPPAPCKDSDGDGVCDAVDKCPGTPKGFKVDADGCIIEQKIILRSVNFEFNKDTLTAPAQATLDEVGAALVGQPKLKVEIAGYTDSVGSAKYNLNLSKKRAASVKKYLVSKGVPAANLVSQGYGKGSPVATNDTEEGRAENRRVEFSVLNKPASTDVVTKGPTKASKNAAEGDPVGKKKVVKHKKVKKATP